MDTIHGEREAVKEWEYRDTSTKVNPRLTKTGNNNTKTWGQGYKSKQGLEIKTIEETPKPMKYNVWEDQSL